MAVSQSLTLTQVSQSVANNTSQVRLVWKSTQSGASWNGYTRTAYYYIATNGGSETGYSVSYTLPQSATTTIVDRTFTVSHKADGTGSVSARSYMDTDISAGIIQKSASLTLTTIPRATQPSVSSSSVDMGTEITINTPRASSGFTHDLAYSFAGGSYVSITTGVGTSYKWTVPDLASKIPNAISGTLTIRCITKNGSTTIGTKTVTMTIKVPESVVPSVSSVAVSEMVSGLAAQFGTFVQSKSKIKATISASGAKGSTIKEYSATFQGKVYTDSSWTSELLTSAGTLTIKARVKDSRGRWSAYKSVDITVQPYDKPKVQALRAYRCNADGTANTEGKYAKIIYQYSVSSVDEKNTAAMSLKWKRSTLTEYTELTTSTALSADTSLVTASALFSTDYQYDIQLTLSDYFGAISPVVTQLPTGAVILDLKADGLGISFGKAAEQAGVEFGWDIVGVIKNLSSLSGQYKTHDGLLLQWGTVSITPTAAGTPTSAIVTYPQPFTTNPLVYVNPVTSVPQNVSLGVLRSTVTDPKLQQEIVLTRDGTTSTVINWLAIGKGAA